MTGKEKCPVMVATTSQSNQIKIQSKDSNYYDSELKRVENAFFERPSTMKEVDKRIAVMRESVCRYCAKLRKQDKLFPIRKRLCNVTGHLAIEWTTNVALIPPKPKQLDLFDSINQETVNDPIFYDLQLRIVEPEYSEYLVFENCAFAGSLKIIPQRKEGFIAESFGWQFLFKGSLDQCDALVENLIGKGFDQ